MISEPGGKGINVAKVLHRLGLESVATGFVGGHSGENILALLEARGIRHQFVTVAGESRLCLNLIDETAGIQTEVLEAGPSIGVADWERLKETVAQLAGDSEYVVFSGSLPAGVDSGAYAELVQVVQQRGAKAIVDTSGEPLAKVLAAKPFMVKPNESELAVLLGKEAHTLGTEEIRDAMNRWHDTGIPLVAVSLGSEGSLVSYEGTCYKVTPPKVELVNPVGCGDTFVAGMAAGLARGLSSEDTIVLATAAAAANAEERQAGCVAVEKLADLQKRVKVEIVNE